MFIPKFVVALLPRLELLSRQCPVPTYRAGHTVVQQVTLDDHSEVVPPLPIPNRTVKHLSADDSGRTSVKVGHCQALTPQNPVASQPRGFVFLPSFLEHTLFLRLLNMASVFKFNQLDVFSRQPLLGNPLAVVHEAQALGEDAMASFARWTNLSETTFLLPPTSAGASG